MAACAALLARRQTGAFIALYGGWTLAAVLPFTPTGALGDGLRAAIVDGVVGAPALKK